MELPSDEPLTALTRVVGHHLTYGAGVPDPTMCVAYSLRFREGVLLIEADPDADSLDLTIGPAPELRWQDDAPREVDLSTTPPWDRLRGGNLGLRWLLVNQQGHHDGVQLEFVRPDRTTTIVQWMVWGSALQHVHFDWWEH